MKVVIVESPAKARTIRGILGSGYRILATAGHVRDLPRKTLGIEMQGLQPQYIIAPGKRKTIRQLREATATAEAVYLATDPDREGEAIAWHVTELLSLPASVPVHRVAFHEITCDAVKGAFDRPRDLDRSLVEAQQARRILDRLLGYRVSPLLWERISGAGKLSARRVQTAALRLVVEREREIEAFVAEEFWEIVALLTPLPRRTAALSFEARLRCIGDKRPEIANRDQAEAIVRVLENADYTRRRYIQKRKPKPVGRSCPECGAGLVIRTGKRGQFVGCSGYPTCRQTEALAA